MNDDITVSVKSEHLSCINCGVDHKVFVVNIGNKMKLNMCEKCLLKLYRVSHEILLYDWSVFELDTNKRN